MPGPPNTLCGVRRLMAAWGRRRRLRSNQDSADFPRSRHVANGVTDLLERIDGGGVEVLRHLPGDRGAADRVQRHWDRPTAADIAHLTGASYDLAAVGPIFEEYVESFALSERLRFIPGDMHHGPLPTAHVICFGDVLRGLGETKRRELIAKAFDAVPIGGAVIVYGAMVDPARPHHFASYPSSPNIMLETREGFDATTTQCTDWRRAADFVGVTTRHLIGPTSMVFGYKPHRVPSEP
jgi:O-methyltransferase domain